MVQNELNRTETDFDVPRTGRHSVCDGFSPTSVPNRRSPDQGLLGRSQVIDADRGSKPPGPDLPHLKILRLAVEAIEHVAKSAQILWVGRCAAQGGLHRFSRNCVCFGVFSQFSQAIGLPIRESLMHSNHLQCLLFVAGQCRDTLQTQLNIFDVPAPDPIPSLLG